MDEWVEQLRQGVILDPPHCRSLCDRVMALLAEEENTLTLYPPLSVVGDVHGQFYDVLEIFSVGGSPPDTQYLFLGDFVDRGHHSVLTISLLCCLKLKFPGRVHLIRGNHESRSVTRVYGFYDECLSRYKQAGPDVWRAFTDLFDHLPVAATIGGQAFATHGGLSPLLQSIDHVRCIYRFQEIPFEGILTDMMWSDPDTEISGFTISKRGVGYLFGRDVLERFLEINNINLFLRAHQLCMEGYQELWDGQFSTVWSAPNYCYRSGNDASILELDEHMNRFYNTFQSSPESARHSTALAGAAAHLKSQPMRMKSTQYFE